MTPTISFVRLFASLVMGMIFLPLLPGIILMAGSLLEHEVWLAVWRDSQWPQALLSTMISTLISVSGALLLTFTILCGLWPGARWQRYVRHLPLLLALPHVAFASGFLFLFTDNGWLSRLLAVDFPVDNPGIALGLMLALKEAWFLLWVASTQPGQSEQEQQLIVARSLGYGPLHSRLLVMVPQLLPRLGWALVVIAAYSLSAVDVATILGPSNPPTLAVLAWQWMNDSDPLAQAMGMLTSLLLLVVLAGFAASGYWLWRFVRKHTGQFSGYRFPFGIPAFSTGLMRGMSLIGAAVLVMLMLWSLAQGWFYPALMPEAVSFSGWQQADYHTLLTALIVALASSFLALATILLWLEGCPRRFDFLILLPPILPALPLAAGQYQVLLRIAQEGTWSAVIWGHLLWVIPYTLLVLKPAWLRLDPRMALMARTFGWSDLKILWRIKVPLLVRPLLGALAMGFSVSVAQYLPTLYAGAGRFATVTTEAVALSSGGDPQQLAIQALLQMLLPAGMFFVTIQLSHLVSRYRQGLR